MCTGNLGGGGGGGGAEAPFTAKTSPFFGENALRLEPLLYSTAINRERKISPKFFRPKFFHGRPRGMSVPKCFFFQNLEGLTEVFGRMSAGISAPNFLFGLIFRS